MAIECIKDKNIEDVLLNELCELGNVDIPYYLEGKNLINLDSYKLTEIEFEADKKYGYSDWLEVNNLEDNDDTKALFREDCQMRKFQKQAPEIVELIIDFLEETFRTDYGNIYADWVERDKLNDLSMKYVVISDMDEDGALISYREWE